MKITEFLTQNYDNLKEEIIDQKDGVGVRFFTPYKEALGETAEKAINYLIDSYVTKSSVFATDTMLDRRALNGIIETLHQVDKEILLLTINVGLKLNIKEQQNLRTAYLFAFATRFLTKINPKDSYQQAKIFRLMQLINKITEPLILGESKDEIAQCAFNSFDKSKKSLVVADLKLSKKTAKNEEEKAAKQEEPVSKTRVRRSLSTSDLFKPISNPESNPTSTSTQMTSSAAPKEHKKGIFGKFRH